MGEKNKKSKLRFLYICPNKECGNIIFKSEKYLDGVLVKIKCQKCKKIFEFDELLVKRI